MEPDRFAVELDQASALLAKFELVDDTRILNSAIAQTSAVLDRMIPGNRLHAVGLTNLSVMLLRRYERCQNVTDIDDAEKRARDALEATPDDDHDSLFARATTSQVS